MSEYDGSPVVWRKSWFLSTSEPRKVDVLWTYGR